jgi:CTP:molybdopterin cytidylyltransferase MocA
MLERHVRCEVIMATKILILGDGFGGIYTALELEKTLARDSDIEVTLVNNENLSSGLSAAVAEKVSSVRYLLVRAIDQPDATSQKTHRGQSNEPGAWGGFAMTAMHCDQGSL